MSFKIESPTLVTLNDKLTLIIPQNCINPFKNLSKPIEVLVITEKDYLKNEYHLQNIINEFTKILFI